MSKYPQEGSVYVRVWPVATQLTVHKDLLNLRAGDPGLWSWPTRTVCVCVSDPVVCSCIWLPSIQSATWNRAARSCNIAPLRMPTGFCQDSFENISREGLPFSDCTGNITGTWGR